MFWKILGHVLLVVLLTLLTQVGGLIWLIALIINRLFFQKRKIRFAAWPIFAVLYLLATFFVVPPLARKFGRVQLPLNSNPHLRSENICFFLFNRNYVRPELKTAVEAVAEKLQAKYPGAVVWYLDACFPFIEGYPLEPHFSHRDGKKIDLAFFWNEVKTGQPTHGTPSPIGYGVCAEAQPGEYDYNKFCMDKGYWYISLDKQLAAPFFNPDRYVFDLDKNRELVRLFAENQSVGKILIEPHLKTRLGLEGFDKLRRQGCKAARHDDHIHIQL